MSTTLQLVYQQLTNIITEMMKGAPTTVIQIEIRQLLPPYGNTVLAFSRLSVRPRVCPVVRQSVFPVRQLETLSALVDNHTCSK